MYRKFWLVNGNNEKFEDIKASFQFGEPSGLGMQSNFTTVRLGNSSLVTYTEQQFVNKSFELRFYGGLVNAYQQYKNFAQFISFEPLYLYYLPPNLKVPLFCSVGVYSIDKGEVGTDGVLRCSAQFQPYTLWKDGEEHIITVTNAERVSGKSYELTRPYSYSVNSLTNIPIYNDGVVGAPIEIEFVGNVVNPQYNLFKEDGTKYGVGRFNGTFERVYVNSDELEESIVLESEGAVLANPYNYQDLSVGASENVLTTFLKLKHGKNLLSFTINSDFDGEINIRWRNEYATI